MTLRSFLCAVDVLMLEDNVSFHAEKDGAGESSVPSPVDMREQNARSMQALMGMMGGVQR